MPNHVHLVVANVGRPNQSPADACVSVESAAECQRGLNLVGRTDCPTDKDESDLLRPAYLDYPLSNMLRKLKWNTALRANRVLGRTGPFWQSESYDHLIRDGQELYRTIWYVLNNPVKARLCKDWREWKWSYVKEGYVGD